MSEFMMQRLNMKNDENLNDDEIMNDSLGTEVLSSKKIFESLYSLYDSISTENTDENTEEFDDEFDKKEDLKHQLTTPQKNNPEETKTTIKYREYRRTHREPKKLKPDSRSESEGNNYNKKRKSIISDVTNDDMTRLVDKNDERLCNFLWCTFKLFSTQERTFNSMQPQLSIAKAAYSSLTDISRDHKERYKQVISTINASMKFAPLNLFSKEGDILSYLKKLIANHFASKNKYSIAILNSEEDLHWALDYINKNAIAEFLFINPISNNEIKAAIISTIDLAFISNENKCINFINRFNKAAQQRKYRKDNNEIIEIPNKTYEKLLILSKAINKSKKETIKFLIEKELKNLTTDTISLAIKTELECIKK